MSEEKIGQHYLAALHRAFPGVVLDEARQTKDQLTITVKVNYLPEVVEFLYYQQGGWLSVLFGNDERKLNGHYAVYYVLSMEQGTKCWITVRVEVDANKPEYPSVTPRVPAAVWGEREVRDMYGLGAGRPAGRTPAGAAGRLAGRTLSAAQRQHGLSPASGADHRRRNLRVY